ncbi:MAG: DUF255 domain-containing protein [Gemmataceae bacterium]|nr:DUF255 domain-containing protein [Gemmataceae bacterium]
MKPTKRPVWFAVAALAFSCSPSSAEPPAQQKEPPIAWRKHWAGARQEARTTKQPMLLVVAFPSCKWWLRMERTTFADPRVRNAIATLIPVLLHGEEDGLLFEQFKVTECPLIAVFDAGGKEVARVQGFQEVQAFLEWLNRHGGNRHGAPRSKNQ